VSNVPDFMPVLSRGKHRTPRKGACFMEMASYLAGERWSDHPSCTHPLLAAMARDVNDHVSDAARSRMVPLIPEVVGLTSRDPRAHVWIAREAALAALPVASAERQRVAAVGVLRCAHVLNELEGRRADHLDQVSRSALDQAPLARDWAYDLVCLGSGSARSFARRSAPTIVHASVRGLAAAVVADPDQLLVDLLQRTTARCRELFPDTGGVGVAATRPAEMA
jgi:class 3 adenylate cyclase